MSHGLRFSVSRCTLLGWVLSNSAAPGTSAVTVTSSTNQPAWFITVEAIGPPTAVKALVLPIPHIAKAIEERDAKALERLKGIGKRTADKIIASLQGKVGKFALMREDEIQEPSDVVDVVKQVEEVLVKDLGHRLTEAQRLVKEAMLRNPAISTPEELFEEVYRGQKKDLL